MSLKMFYICVMFLIVSVSASIPYRPVTKSGVPCMVPFEYKGKSYQDCSKMGSSRPWCYTSVARDWDYCDKYLDKSKCHISNPLVNGSEISTILGILNGFRQKIPAKRMAKLRWNPELAMRSQYMSDQCQITNNDQTLCDSDHNMGQISFASMSSGPQQHKWLDFIMRFYKKQPEYSLESNSCGSDSCFGFKQLISSKTTEVGCGVRSCNTDSVYQDFYFCTFYPPFYSNKKPYEVGSQTCDACYKLDSVNKYRCSSGLCEVCETTDSNCQGIDYWKNQIKSGSICEDIDPSYCKMIAGYCTMLDKLPANHKDRISDNCRKTCGMCH